MLRPGVWGEFACRRVVLCCWHGLARLLMVCLCASAAGTRTVVVVQLAAGSKGARREWCFSFDEV